MAQSFYTPFTVASGQVPSTQSNFPVVIIPANDTRFKTIANGGHVNNSNGFDIRPYSDSSLSTALSYELVSYDGVNGTFEMWVLATSISNGTVIYIGYGDSSLTTDGTNKAAVWNNQSYKIILHCDTTGTVGGSSGGLFDSSGNGNDAKSIAGTLSVVAGKIGNGIQFDGATWNSIPSAAQGGTAAALTWQGWFYPPSASVGTYPFCKEDGTGTNTTDWDIYFDANVPTNVRAAGFHGGVRSDSGFGSGFTYAANTWYLVHGTFDGSNVQCWINGATNGTATAMTSPNDDTSTCDIFIGLHPAGTAWPNGGKMDELRFRRAACSADWIATEYNNQNAPNTFFSIGSETVPGSGVFPPRSQFFFFFPQTTK